MQEEIPIPQKTLRIFTYKNFNGLYNMETYK